MSLIKKSDVKNHLSARRRSRMHPQPQRPADAPGAVHEELAGVAREGIAPLEGHVNIGSRRGQQSVPIEMPKRIQN